MLPPIIKNVVVFHSSVIIPPPVNLQLKLRQRFLYFMQSAFAGIAPKSPVLNTIAANAEKALTAIIALFIDISPFIVLLIFYHISDTIAI